MERCGSYPSYRGAVPIRRIFGDDGQRIDAQLHHFAVGALVRLLPFERREDGFELFAHEHGDDGGRGFVRAEAVVVARARHGEAQKILMVVDRLDDRHQKEHELPVFGGRRARIEQVEPRIRAHRPVVVLARAVDALEGLFVQQAHEPVAARDFLHDLHHELVLIGRHVDGEVKMGASSCWAGATSLCLVLARMPYRHSSSSSSFMNAETRGLMGQK